MLYFLFPYIFSVSLLFLLATFFFPLCHTFLFLLLSVLYFFPTPLPYHTEVNLCHNIALALSLYFLVVYLYYNGCIRTCITMVVYLYYNGCIPVLHWWKPLYSDQNVWSQKLSGWCERETSGMDTHNHTGLYKVTKSLIPRLLPTWGGAWVWG